jgi:hypothetical protein
VLFHWHALFWGMLFTRLNEQPDGEHCEYHISTTHLRFGIRAVGEGDGHKFFSDLAQSMGVDVSKLRIADCGELLGNAGKSVRLQPSP